MIQVIEPNLAVLGGRLVAVQLHNCNILPEPKDESRKVHLDGHDHGHDTPEKIF